MDDQLLSEFLAEADYLIEELYGDVASLRERRGEGRARRALVARIFRRVHTIKGSASAAGLEATGALAHEFESLLDAVRAGRAVVDDEVLAAFDEAVGAVAATLSAVARGERADAPHELVARLRRLSSDANAAPASDESDDEKLLPAEVARTLSAHERQRLREAVSEGARAYVVEADFRLATFDEQYRRLSDALGEGGEVVSTQPFVEQGAPEHVGFRIVYASDEARDEVLARVAPLGARLSEDADALNARRGVERDAEEASARQSELTTPKLVRVSLEELDELISSAHGLFADTRGALDLALADTNAGEGRAETETRAELETRTEIEMRAARIRRGFSELEGRLIALRMVPLRATLARAARAGESVARAAGKSVEFETAGGDVRLDRSLADRVAEPLLHLIRNAVGHGIEDAEERRASGKRERGRVRVEALAEEGRVVLRVNDDGRGVDAEGIARAAAERGLVAPGTRLTDEQALRLIFRPGFSTSSRATLVSGRGVGLDVVERAVEEAGGEVRVRSERGRGTVFEMRLPTTLALLPAHVVRCGGHLYCVAASQLFDAGQAVRADIKREGARRTLRWRGRALPVVHMREILGQPTPDADDGDGARIAFVVVRARAGRDDEEDETKRCAAVVVDGWEGQTEVLVRGLGRHAKRWRGVVGATELSGGEVALVIDLPRLLEALV